MELKKSGGRHVVGILDASETESGVRMGLEFEGERGDQVTWFVNLLRVRTGFPREVFDRVVLPVIVGLRESREAGEVADRVLVRRLAVATRALELRRGLVLPRGMPPELVGGLAHRWTWAVVIAALADAFVNEGGAAGAGGTGWTCLEHVAPAEAMAWLREDADVTEALRAFLSGDGDRAGTLAGIIRRAKADVFGAERVLCTAEDAAADVGEAGVAADTVVVAAPVEDSSESPIAQAFLDWLRDAAKQGAIEMNTPKGVICLLEEGTLIADPVAFREFARRVTTGECPQPSGTTATGRDLERVVRREVMRAGWHVASASEDELVDGCLDGGGTVRGLLLRPSIKVLRRGGPVAGAVRAPVAKARG